MQGRAFMPVLAAGEAQFYKSEPGQFAVKLRQNRGCRTFASDLLGVGHRLAESAEAGFLGTG